jgi:hypothetical protein
MKILQTYPGQIMAAGFIAAGILFTALVSVGENLAGLAGRGFDDGVVNEAGWQETEFAPLPGSGGNPEGPPLFEEL